ncbi:cellular retinoic acid-binding protein 1-like [Mizuhopecten yessoensis]|uniref:Cellular retinoic acid-binding protein 1 n=1 Tax=Mizuhopecten yessoensis TaxID=6573 RepID=A0A210PTE4_MIZYE|nr:cellular retinoic acid-binding protein 1-like [Mizuhopecten yessoensis]XP_021375651.1 cellular retinoic acid-binding protein 1-like [Mizuhopecten yessoensis]XP_021375652.1 cellular retinoic acid-binding protein 1-like [Mizuhopecten yessoensis]XP_021375653.1 cellular retinoic acid-binding protein 1-like [Mizuhopecten yessoensis]OWF39777.1 Cellular retinoic acid-binding protein 1 [Mizuhopecten yessoensis]
MALDQIKDSLVGKWKMDRSENFEEFLKEVGVNMVLRKLAPLAKPTMNISIEGETIKIITDIAVRREEDFFKLDEVFEKEREGEMFRGCATWEDGKLKITGTPLNSKSKMKAPTIYRERVGDEMLLTMCVSDVVCKRYFKRLE